MREPPFRFSDGQTLTETGSGYPPRSAAEDPSARIMWVGDHAPVLEDGAAHAGDMWFVPDGPS